MEKLDLEKPKSLYRKNPKQSYTLWVYQMNDMLGISCSVVFQIKKES